MKCALSLIMSGDLTAVSLTMYVSSRASKVDPHLLAKFQVIKLTAHLIEACIEFDRVSWTHCTLNWSVQWVWPYLVNLLHPLLKCALSLTMYVSSRASKVDLREGASIYIYILYMYVDNMSFSKNHQCCLYAAPPLISKYSIYELPETTPKVNHGQSIGVYSVQLYTSFNSLPTPNQRTSKKNPIKQKNITLSAVRTKAFDAKAPHLSVLQNLAASTLACHSSLDMRRITRRGPIFSDLLFSFGRPWVVSFLGAHKMKL